MNKLEKVYAIYKGDKFIDLGTKKELAEKLKIKPKSICYYISPSYQKRSKVYNKRLIVIEIKDN